MMFGSPAEIVEQMLGEGSGYTVSVRVQGDEEDISLSYNAMVKLCNYFDDADGMADFLAMVVKSSAGGMFDLSLDDSEDSAFCIWRGATNIIMVDAGRYEELGTTSFGEPVRLPVPVSLKLSDEERDALIAVYDNPEAVLTHALRPKGYSGNN
jgi:hypothetical protein